MMDNYLEHHGILGQKWGIRRFQNEDGTYTQLGRERYNKNRPNADYTDKQRKYDRAVYSKGAERRINRRMNEGYGIKAARSLEAQRINSARNRASAASTVGGIVGAGVGFFAPEIILAGAKALAKTGNFPFINSNIHVLKDERVKMIVRIGASFVAPILASKAARNTAMRVQGYSPKKFYGPAGTEGVGTAQSILNMVGR